MQQQLWTLNALAVELDRDRRVLARDLEGLIPDDESLVGASATIQGDAFVDSDVIDTSARKIRRWKLCRVIAHLYQNSNGGALNAIDEQRRRLLEQQADKAEIENQIRSGQYVNLELASKEWGRQVTIVRTRLLAIPSKLAPHLVNIKAPWIVVEKLKEALYEAMSELANDRVQAKHGKKRKRIEAQHEVKADEPTTDEQARVPATDAGLSKNSKRSRKRATELRRRNDEDIVDG
jgi:phage terminase Nu1 subunit (DNA packaging protein)